MLLTIVHLGDYLSFLLLFEDLDFLDLFLLLFLLEIALEFSPQKELLSLYLLSSLFIGVKPLYLVDYLFFLLD